ncbi:Uncharacterised protein [uncultured archaeon]|nr:Uncharacterised protein [uncultured archaeon]
MRQLLALLFCAALFFGCIGSPQNPPLQSYPASQGFEGYNASAGNGSYAQNVPSATAQKTEYIVFASIVQYDLQSRHNLADDIQKAYAVEVDITNFSSGSYQPLSAPEKAKITLTGPSGEIPLSLGPISQSDYGKLPVSAIWQVTPGFSDPMNTQFVYAKAGSLLPGGIYSLSVDADGDGTVDGASTLTVPGAAISTPTFGSRQSNTGYTLQWSQAGNPNNMTYTITTGRGFAGLDGYLANAEPLPSTSMAVPKDVLPENGNYLLNFQVESGTLDSTFMDYSTGKAHRLVFFPLTVKEAHLVLYNVGEFCHCDDAFATRSCTVEEIAADPLCN